MQQRGEDADEFIWTRPPTNRGTGSGVTVTLWDEVAPARPLTLPTLTDDPSEE
ncbi:hypothetical protein [Caballeronia hypogeia]|uniref:hypothetical protein n=1 Tax=Caballeronia hypogeia TaxID=1777140 RepID=UPI001E4382BA|nr:hypothetical protein [Caballeronia hypogeia]